MFSKSKLSGENIHGASGPGPATYKMKHLFDDAGAQQPKQRARKPQVLPMLLGKKPSMVLCKKPPCKEPPKIEPQIHLANDCNDWSDIFECKSWLANGATGMVFFGTLKVQRTPVALKRVLKTNFDEKMAHYFFREFKITKACQHPNIATVFSAYEVPFPAFIMELLGKTKDQSTTELGR